MTQSSLPIIDLACVMEVPPTCFGDETADLKSKTCRELVEILHSTGFVYIKNHSLPQDEVNEAFAMSKRFFSLPMEDKMKAPHPPGWQVHRGYSQPGLEKVSNAMAMDDNTAAQAKVLRQIEDYKESYEIGSENFEDMPNVWPPQNILPEWKPFTTEFYWKCFRIASKILEAIAEGLGVDKDSLLLPHSGQNGQLRMLHYPPIPAQEIDQGRSVRMPSHSDWSTLTMLFQDDCGGLQVERPDQPGEFVDVAPVEGTLVLNVGDLLMRWSNGEFVTNELPYLLVTMKTDYLRSTQHRVTLPPLQDRYSGAERMTRARYSIPFFLSPDPDIMIRCLDLGDGHGPKYEPITQREYAAMRARVQY